MSIRDARLAKNEVVFREVNERIREVTSFPEGAEFLCECPQPECVEPIGMSVAEYEAVRQHPARFVVVPGHETPEIERIVERHERYVVVEKREGVPADVATAHDPRT